MNGRRNNSKKRSAVLDELCARTDHPTAESIYKAVKTAVPEISLGTVYRNISVLEAEGEIISVGSVDGNIRYDGRTDDHAHLICRSCKKVIDVEISLDTAELFARAAELTGARADGYSLSFTGLCAQCVKEENNIA